MLNKLKSILPGQMPTLQFNEVDHSFGLGFNQALTEIEALLPDMLALIREEIEKEMTKKVNKIVGIKNGKFEIVGGLFTDHKMRGPNVERIDLINRYDVHKAIQGREDEYCFDEDKNPVTGY